MRIPFLLALLVLGTNVATTQSASAGGRWCYLNEDEHCDQVSFESCLFGTFGNGGYCYQRVHHWRPSRSHDFAWSPPRHEPIRAHRWCLNSEDEHCDQPSFESCLFSTFGNGGYCYVAAARRAHHHHPHMRLARARHKPRTHEAVEAMASAHTEGAEKIAEPCAADANGGIENTACSAKLRLASAEPMPQLVGTAVLARSVAPKDFPRLNVVPSCRAAAAIGLGSGATDACIADENHAREQLVSQWNELPRADRSSCVGLTTIGGGGTYTALLTCLEMKQFARGLPKSDPSAVMLASR